MFIYLFIYFLVSHPFYTHQSIHVKPNRPVHHTTTPTPRRFPPLVSIRLFSTSVSQFLLCKPVHLYHFLGSEIWIFSCLGSWVIHFGQHQWEVDVAGCCSWAIGFCNDSWTRKSDMVLVLEGIFLLLCIKGNNQCSLFTSSPLSPQYVRRPLGHVWVFLDYDGGVLSFVNVASSSLICSFLSCSFSSPLKPFLCSGHPWSGTGQKIWPQVSGMSITEIVHLVPTWFSVTSPSFMKHIDRFFKRFDILIV